MKGRVVSLLLAALLLSIPGISSAATVQEPDVTFAFSWFDYGIVVVVWNNEDVPVHHVTLNSLDISGFIFLGWSSIYFLAEVGAHSIGYLAIPVFGWGRCLVTANISYEYEGTIYTATLHGLFFVLGTTTLLLREW